MTQYVVCVLFKFQFLYLLLFTVALTYEKMSSSAIFILDIKGKVNFYAGESKTEDVYGTYHFAELSTTRPIAGIPLTHFSHFFQLFLTSEKVRNYLLDFSLFSTIFDPFTHFFLFTPTSTNIFINKIQKHCHISETVSVIIIHDYSKRWHAKPTALNF